MVLIPDDQVNNLHAAPMWKVKFDHFTKDIQFVTCSELQATAQTYRYGEGGDLIGEEFVAGFEFDDITLERGQDQDDQMQNWWDQICNVKKKVSTLPSIYKHNGELILLNLDGTDGPRWNLTRTFIKTFKAVGGADANNKTANIVTSMVLGVKSWEYKGLT